MIAPVDGSQAGLQADIQSAKTKGNPLRQEDFLKLLVAQIQNQDPTQPLDSSEFLSQISQLSTVQGIQDATDLMRQMMEMSASNSAFQAASLLDRMVVVPGGMAPLEQGRLAGSVDVPHGMSNVQISINDQAGATIKTLSLPDGSVGQIPFKWDGIGQDGNPAADGLYTIEAKGSIDGELVSLTTYVGARVQSISIGSSGEGTLLNLGALGAISLGDVREIMG